MLSPFVGSQFSSSVGVHIVVFSTFSLKWTLCSNFVCLWNPWA